jgi:hypothetical protein
MLSLHNKEVISMEGKNKPAAHFKVKGIRVSLWRESRKGPTGTFASWSITMDRSYKDAQGQWQHTSSLKEHDLPKAILALQKAYEYLCEKGGEETEDQP